MSYILKEEKAEEIKNKYKNSYFKEKLDLSGTYVSLIVNRKIPISKRLAYAFTKVIDVNAETEDYFELK